MDLKNTFRRSVTPLFLFVVLGIFSGIEIYAQERRGNASAGTTKKENFSPTNSSKWPKQVPGPQNFKLREREIKAKKNLEQEPGFSYETTNYKFVSPIKLDEAAKTAIGELCEGTYCAVKALPLPIPRADKRHSRDRLDVILVATREDYLKKGGPEKSSGVFISRGDGKSDFVLVPFASFGLSSKGTFSAGGKMSKHTLAHELAHQLTDRNFGRITWANEGFAEYIGYTPYENKKYNFTGTFEKIKEMGKRYCWDLPYSFEDFIEMPQKKFYEYGHQAYTLSAMTLAFFFHLDGEEGVKNFSLYMKELQRSGDGKKANKKLLGKRKTMKALQADFVKAWEAHGIHIKFKGD